jgi:hypothetical protein
MAGPLAARAQQPATATIGLLNSESSFCEGDSATAAGGFCINGIALKFVPMKAGPLIRCTAMRA